MPKTFLRVQCSNQIVNDGSRQLQAVPTPMCERDPKGTNADIVGRLVYGEATVGPRCLLTGPLSFTE